MQAALTVSDSEAGYVGLGRIIAEDTGESWQVIAGQGGTLGQSVAVTGRIPAELAEKVQKALSGNNYHDGDIGLKKRLKKSGLYGFNIISQPLIVYKTASQDGDTLFDAAVNTAATGPVRDMLTEAVEDTRTFIKGLPAGGTQADITVWYKNGASRQQRFLFPDVTSDAGMSVHATDASGDGIPDLVITINGQSRIYRGERDGRFASAPGPGLLLQNRSAGGLDLVEGSLRPDRSQVAVIERRSQGSFLVRPGKAPLPLPAPRKTEPLQWLTGGLSTNGPMSLIALYVTQEDGGVRIHLDSLQLTDDDRLSPLRSDSLLLQGLGEEEAFFVNAADLDGDGRLDLLITAGNQLSFCLGDGLGGFSAPGSRTYVSGHEDMEAVRIPGREMYHRLSSPVRPLGSVVKPARNNLFPADAAVTKFINASLIHQEVVTTEKETTIFLFCQDGTFIHLRRSLQGEWIACQEDFEPLRLAMTNSTEAQTTSTRMGRRNYASARLSANGGGTLQFGIRDLNGDGHADIMLWDPDGDTFTLSYWNEGKKQFEAAQDLNRNEDEKKSDATQHHHAFRHFSGWQRGQHALTLAGKFTAKNTQLIRLTPGGLLLSTAEQECTYTQSISSCSKAARTRIPMSIEPLCDWGECSQPTQLQLERRRVYADPRLHLAEGLQAILDRLYCGQWENLPAGSQVQVVNMDADAQDEILVIVNTPSGTGVQNEQAAFVLDFDPQGVLTTRSLPLTQEERAHLTVNTVRLRDVDGDGLTDWLFMPANNMNSQWIGYGNPDGSRTLLPAQYQPAVWPTDFSHSDVLVGRLDADDERDLLFVKKQDDRLMLRALLGTGERGQFTAMSEWYIDLLPGQSPAYQLLDVEADGCDELVLRDDDGRLSALGLRWQHGDERPTTEIVLEAQGLLPGERWSDEAVLGAERDTEGRLRLISVRKEDGEVFRRLLDPSDSEVRFEAGNGNNVLHGLTSRRNHFVTGTGRNRIICGERADTIEVNWPAPAGTAEPGAEARHWWTWPVVTIENYKSGSAIKTLFLPQTDISQLTLRREGADLVLSQGREEQVRLPFFTDAEAGQYGRLHLTDAQGEQYQLGTDGREVYLYQGALQQENSGRLVTDSGALLMNAAGGRLKLFASTANVINVQGSDQVDEILHYGDTELWVDTGAGDDLLVTGHGQNRVAFSPGHGQDSIELASGSHTTLALAVTSPQEIQQTRQDNHLAVTVQGAEWQSDCITVRGDYQLDREGHRLTEAMVTFALQGEIPAPAQLAMPETAHLRIVATAGH